MDNIECIAWKGQPLCYIIRKELDPHETTFVTPPELNLQVGFIVYSAEHEIPRHTHSPIERRIVGTPEVLVVRKGCCELDIYNDDHECVAKRGLRTGDIMVMVAGGHGFRMLEDTVLLEVKQGPYPGMAEKERF